jgi:hypothetical protein
MEVMTTHKAQLEIRQTHFRSVYGRLLGIFVASAVLITLHSGFDLNYYVLGFWIASLVLLIFALVKSDSNNRKLESLEVRIEGQRHSTEVTDLQDQLESRCAFYRELEDRDKTMKLNFGTGEISIFCLIWDRIAGTYAGNGDAIICPKCGGHNGLSKATADARYRCAYCHTAVGPKRSQETG